MDYLIMIGIGLVMGVFGGLLGIGGSIVMIPAMVIFFKQKPEDQHLFQAAAMICNFFVAFSATLIHKKKRVLVIDVVKWLVPAGVIGIGCGVWLSNIDFFSGQNAVNLTRVFGAFMVYVAVLNIFKLGITDGGDDGLDISAVKKSNGFSTLCGYITGISAGLLGLGGGTVCTPLQQFLLKMPLKRAISNSSALIAFTSVFGAVFKNATLSQHGFSITDSVRIAAVIIPTAIIGSLFGGRLLHKLDTKIVRIAFIALLLVAAYKLLTIS